MKVLITQLRWLCIALTLMPAMVLSAAQEHSDKPLTKSESLSFELVFEASLQSSPQALSTPSRKQQSDSYKRLGSRWITGAPKMIVNYTDDSGMDNTGLREMEAGVAFDLWQPGAKRAAQELGRLYEQQVSAWKDYLRLMVAGKLRTNFADMQEREIALHWAQQTREDVKRLLEIARGLFKAGAISHGDVLQAQSLLLHQEASLLDANADLIDAERQYRNLTGLSVRPSVLHTEVQSSLEAINPEHPLLSYIQTQVDVARTKALGTKKIARGGPTVSIGMRRERGDSLQDDVDSLGIGISIPFGAGAVVSAKVSDANRVQADVQVKYQTVYRQLIQQLHEVEHELSINQSTIELSKKQVDLNLQRRTMAEKAFKVGETTMAEFVLATQQYHQAVTQLHLGRSKRQRLISEFNQTVGVLP